MSKTILSGIEKLDRSNMLSLILNFSKQMEDACKIGREFEPGRDMDGIKCVIISGMGGSAIGGELLQSYLLDEIKIPIYINRNYSLPEFADPSTLTIISSYSGNTEETVNSLLEAIEKGCKIICITTGGKILKIAKSRNLNYILIPPGYPPRTALAYSFFPMLFVMRKVGLISDKSDEIGEAVKIISEKAREYNPYNNLKDNPPLSLAGQLLGKLPIIYTSINHLGVVGNRWKGQLAENSKILAFYNQFPELNHNEIVGWEVQKDILEKCHLIFLRDRFEHPRIDLRFEITKEILIEISGGFTEIYSDGDGLLTRIFSLIYLGDFTSFFLAILNCVDPTPVSKIDYLKKELAKKVLDKL